MRNSKGRRYSVGRGEGGKKAVKGGRGKRETQRETCMQGERDGGREGGEGARVRERGIKTRGAGIDSFLHYTHPQIDKANLRTSTTTKCHKAPFYAPLTSTTLLPIQVRSQTKIIPPSPSAPLATLTHTHTAPRITQMTMLPT